MATRKLETAEEFHQVLNEPHVRITFGVAFGIKGAIQTAHLEVGELVGTRAKWTKITPMLLEHDGGGRADLLQQMINVLAMEVGADGVVRGE